MLALILFGWGPGRFVGDLAAALILEHGEEAEAHLRHRIQGEPFLIRAAIYGVIIEIRRQQRLEGRG